MPDNKTDSIHQKGRWLKRLGIGLGALVVLLGIAYFVVTSGAFFKSVILPRAGKALNAEITVTDAQISPFSQVILQGLKITPKGAETLLTANTIKARYSLWSIIGGKIVVEEVSVSQPTITLVEDENGVSNLDPLKQKSTTPAKPASSSSAPPQIDIKSVLLENATIRRTKKVKGGSTEAQELSGVTVKLANLKNGQTGTASITASMTEKKSGSSPATPASSLAAKLLGDFSFGLSESLAPTTAKGNASFNIGEASGEFADFSGLGASLDCEASPTEIKQLALQFSKSGTALGTLKVNGPFDAAKLEGRLNIELLSLDRRVLNLAGAAQGIDFGTTLLNFTNVIELTQAGSVITAKGRFDAGRLQIIRGGQMTPTLDLQLDYAAKVDRTAEVLTLTSLNLTGSQNQRPMLRTELTSPMNIAWGKTSGAVGDASLNVNLTDLNLADWQAFASGLDPRGTANVKLQISSKQAGKELGFNLDSQLANLSAKMGSNSFSQLDVKIAAQGAATDLKQFTLSQYRLTLGYRNEAVVDVSGSGKYDTASQAADLQTVVNATLKPLLTLIPQPDMAVTSGSVQWQGRIQQQSQVQTVTGALSLTNFNGSYSSYHFANFSTRLDTDVGLTGQQVDIRKFTGQLFDGVNVGGGFAVSGKYDLAQKSGSVNLALTNLNERAVRPFLEPSLAGKKLNSISINTTVATTLNATGDATVKADLRLANLVVQDPKERTPATPLEGRVQLDASWTKKVAQIRQCELTLSPTDRAKNDFNFTGSLDLSRSNAITGNLKLAADSLDFTRYYDLFAGSAANTTNAVVAIKQPTSPAPAPARDPNQEPAAINLPVQDLSAAVSIGKLYLREIAITNLQTTVKIQRSHVVVNPFQLSLNGAPVSSTVDLDLGQPGYKYNLTLSAQKIPAAPLVNSFQPDQSGKIGGNLTATANIKGAGVTGPNLRKNLDGQFGIVATNLNYSIADVRIPLLNGILNTVIGLPDLIRNPLGFAANLWSDVTGASSKTNGWANQIFANPIDAITAKGRMNAGEVTLEDASVRSAAFLGQAAGTIGINDILTNSTLQIPVKIALNREMADKIGMVPSGTPTNAYYAQLPDFLTIKGTIGNPKEEINKLVLAQFATKAGIGIATGTGGAIREKAGGLLNAAESVLGLKPSTNNAANPTNTPAKRPGLLNIFR